MLPLNILLLALPLAFAAPTPAATPAPIAEPIKPIFGSWGDSVRPFKPGKVGDKFNPSQPSQEPQNITPPPPPRSPSKKAEAEIPSIKGQKQAKESQNRNDITRMAASNSVALFNGVPVDPHTGQPINPPAEELEENLQKRGLLKKKLGLQFLDDPNVDENVVRKHLKSPEIGMGLAAPKDQHPALMQVPPGAPAAAANALPAVMAPQLAQANALQQPKQAQKQPWNGNAYMVVNGVPMAVEGDVTGKALDISKFAPGTTLQKRGDVRSKLGLGMFDVPGVSGRRKTSAPPPGEVEYEEVALEDPATAPAPEPEPIYEVPEVHHQEEVEELELQDLGKSFVIYNGMPVEINGYPVHNKKLKKPRPAFRGNRESARMVKREADAEPAAGKKYNDLNPFKNNPITGNQRGNANNANKKARDGTKGGTNSNTVKGTEHSSQSPHTSEEEFVRINTGDSTCIFNGRPVTLSGNSLFDGMKC